MFCSNCLDAKFKDCDNRLLTGGEFQLRMLKVKSDNGTVAYPLNVSENEDDYVEDINVDQITVVKQELQFTDLEIGNIIVVPVKDERHNTYYFPGEITKLLNSKAKVHINYLKSDLILMIL